MGRPSQSPHFRHCRRPGRHGFRAERGPGRYHAGSRDARHRARRAERQRADHDAQCRRLRNRYAGARPRRFGDRLGALRQCAHHAYRPERRGPGHRRQPPILAGQPGGRHDLYAVGAHDRVRQLESGHARALAGRAGLRRSRCALHAAEHFRRRSAPAAGRRHDHRTRCARNVGEGLVLESGRLSHRSRRRHPIHRRRQRRRQLRLFPEHRAHAP